MDRRFTVGLFNKHSRHGSQDDFSSTNETIDLTATTAHKRASGTLDDDDDDNTEHDWDTDDEVDRELERGLESGVDGEVSNAPHYGIEEAISLMRALPSDSVELVVQVVKQTLLSAKIDIREILVEASTRKGQITSDIKTLEEEISFFDNEITDRKAQIVRLRTDHDETSLVEERLQLAESLEKSAAKKSEDESDSNEKIENDSDSNKESEDDSDSNKKSEDDSDSNEKSEDNSDITNDDDAKKSGTK